MPDTEDNGVAEQHVSEENPTPQLRRKKKRKPILTPGQVLAGSYEVIEQIGEGGMAIVYKARQRSLNRMVAVKALHPKLAKNSEFIERFEAESGALAALSHPNIINIIDRGHQDDVYYFVMEYVDGEDLDQKIIENRLTFNDWRQVVAACSSALEYVHKRGVVHRDIKPSNILVDSEGRIKIGDFGIAHIITGDTVEGEEGIKAHARAVGTANYMAPEQVDDPANVDHRADVYALGVTFYKMMTRQLPVGEFPPPSEANNEVPVSVDEVIYRSLAYDRGDRHQSVAELCDDMLRALKDQSVSIASILNYRSKNPSSSLYTGADFRKSPTPASSSDVPRRKGDTGTGTTGTGRGAKTPSRSSSTTGARLLKSKKPEGSGRVHASKDLTPLPMEPAEAPTGPAQSRGGSNRVLIALVLALALSGLGIIAIVLWRSSPTGPPPPVGADQIAPITDPISDSIEREERLRRQREERQRELMSGTIAGEVEPDEEADD